MDQKVAKRVIPVVGAVIVDHARVLCARRRSGGNLAGHWEFPGGKVEANETPHEALVREIDEELRCQVEVGDEIASTRHEYDFAIIVLTTFYCRLLSGTPRLTDHDEIRWCLPEQMNGLRWAPADLPAVRQVALDLGS